MSPRASLIVTLIPAGGALVCAAVTVLRLRIDERVYLALADLGRDHVGHYNRAGRRSAMTLGHDHQARP